MLKLKNSVIDKMIISVASGKGGTGKTLVATSLALSLKDKYSVQMLDCDVEEPNDHIFFKPTITGSEDVNISIPKIDENKCTNCGKCAEVCAYHAIAVLPNTVLVFPNLCHGCGACAYLCPENAITEEDNQIGVVEYGQADKIDFVQGKLNVSEAMPTPVIKKVKEYVNDKCVSIIDVPPGTSCPVVESVTGSDFCLLVTEPTPFGLNDLTLAVETVKALGIPCGIVINRAGKDNDVIEDYCVKENLPVLLTIPFDIKIAKLYSRGITLVEGIPQWKENFIELFNLIQEQVYERNHSLKR
ncbi:MAG: ATP-binding protein [Dehalococcoidales bacterium]|nr:ATP-binding protein [Dehalococcoidales bacterium]